MEDKTSWLWLTQTMALSTLLLCTPASAQDAAANYPSRTVTIISPYVPGGSTDNGGRLYTQKLTEMLGNSISNSIEH